jgi:hypothetical protein
MNKKRTFTLVLAALFVMSIFTSSVFAGGDDGGGGEYGCTPGFWKNHRDVWPVGNDPVVSVFGNASPYIDGTDTLYDALRYKGGKGADGAARILLRAATAAWLNANSMDYYYGTGWIQWAVDSALVSGDRAVMLSLAAELDGYNNGVCMPCQSGPVVPPS